MRAFKAVLNYKAETEKQKFSDAETKNTFFYVAGIMLYKFGLETFLGTISVTAAEGFDPASAFILLGALSGANQAAQCVGSIIVTPIIAKAPVSRVLAASIWGLALLSLSFLVAEAATGGTLTVRGTWNLIEGLFPIFTISGVFHGMVELIRRIIPKDIGGSDDHKLRRLDSVIHVCYEVTGTGSAFFTVYMINVMGRVYASCYVPAVFFAAGVLWLFMSLKKDHVDEDDPEADPDIKILKKKSIGSAIGGVFKGFGLSVWRGAKIIFSSRKFIWLVPGYVLPLVFHRYLESQLCPAFAKTILKNTSYSQIMVGGSNFGELSGALIVFFFSAKMPSPFPWARFDSMTLNLLWVLPYAYPFENDVFGYTWLLALMLVFVSTAYAASSVSLSAYIQSSLATTKYKGSVSPLGSVMAFLYAMYIIIYGVGSFGLGKVFDSYNSAGNPRGGLFWLSGVMMTCAFATIFASTFIPRGAIALNPSYADLGMDTAPEEAAAIQEEEDKEEFQENAAAGKYFDMM